jgi:hypothetical protein
MAFIVLQSEKDRGAWVTLALDLGYGHTSLAGQGGRPVLAIPDTAVDELAERGIAFTAIREAQLPDYLTPQGLAYYQLLRKIQPDHLYFNAPLPPAFHVAMNCTVPEPNVEAVRQIVQRHQPVEVRTTEVTLFAISTDSDRSDEAQPMVRVEFVVPRSQQQAIMDELMASGAAGTSRATAIYVQSDPDGPPRGRKENPGRR